MGWGAISTRAVLATGVVLAGVVCATGTASAKATTERVSVSSAGGQGDAASAGAAVSASGRFIAFASDAANLVAGDTNGVADIFVRDRRLGITRRVSIGPRGSESNGPSSLPAISADGRFVAFISEGSNLVVKDTNDTRDVFVRDLLKGTTRRVSVSSAGGQGNAGIEPYRIAISGNGRFVTFASGASNLVPKDRNDCSDVYVRDRWHGTTRLVSRSSAGAPGNTCSFTSAISPDGRFVAFDSYASNLVGGDTNDASDVFVRDLRTATTRRVSVSSAGVQGAENSFDPAISAGGRFIAFDSFADNLVPGGTSAAFSVFVRDRGTGTTKLVSFPASSPGDSFGPAISGNGRLIAYWSGSSSVASADVLVRDRRRETTRRIAAGAGNIGFLDAPAISADGRVVAFWSDDAELVPGDSNGVSDVFARAPLWWPR